MEPTELKSIRWFFVSRTALPTPGLVIYIFIIYIHICLVTIQKKRKNSVAKETALNKKQIKHCVSLGVATLYIGTGNHNKFV